MFIFFWHVARVRGRIPWLEEHRMCRGLPYFSVAAIKSLYNYINKELKHYLII